MKLKLKDQNALEKEIEVLKNYCEKNEEMSLEAKNQLSEAKKDYDKNIQNLNAIIENLKKQNEFILNNQVKKYESEKQRILKDNYFYKVRCMELEKYEKESKEISQLESCFESSLEKFKDEFLKKSFEKFNNQDNELKNLKNENRKLKLKIGLLQEENSSLRKDKDELKEKLENEIEKFHKLKSELEKISSEEISNQENTDNFHDFLSKTEEKIKGYTKASIEIFKKSLKSREKNVNNDQETEGKFEKTKLIEELNKQSKTVSKLQIELNEAGKMLCEMGQRKQELKWKITTLEQEILQSKQLNEKLKNTSQISKNKDLIIKNLEMKIEMLNSVHQAEKEKFNNMKVYFFLLIFFRKLNLSVKEKVLWRKVWRFTSKNIKFILKFYSSWRKLMKGSIKLMEGS